MRSSTPIVIGFLALVAVAFWYDAHAHELVDAAVGARHDDVAAVAASTNKASPTSADQDSPVLAAAGSGVVAGGK